MASRDNDNGAGVPWYAPGHVTSATGVPYTPRPRERLWTLVKAGKRVDAELLFHNEHGVAVQFAHEGVMASAHRWALRQYALEEAEEERQRLLRDGWAEWAAANATERSAC